MQTTNPFQDAARAKKAAALAQVLIGHQVTTETVELVALDPDARELTEKVADVNPASDTTWEQVIAIVRTANVVRDSIATALVHA